MKDRLKEIRKMFHLTQKQLAERLEIKSGASLIGLWECGSNPIPGDKVYRICKEFNIRREWLEKGEGEMFEPLDVKGAQDTLLRRILDVMTDEELEILLDSIRERVETRSAAKR